MEEPMTDQPCKCPGIKNALHYALTDATPPECPQHDQGGGAAGPAIALNDNKALAAAIGANLTQEN